MGSDYAPVSQDEDELEPRSRYLDYAAEGQYQYPPVAPAPSVPAPAASASGYPPVESPAAPSIGSLGDLEARAARPKTAIQDEAPPPVTPRPQWKDYAPAEPHGWAKFGHVMAALTGPTNKIFNADPERRAEEKYKNASAEYEAPVAEEHVKAETEELGKRGEHEQAEADQIRNPPVKPPTNDFELWARQNPDKPVGEWLKLQNESKPDKPDTATQNKENFQHGIGVLRGEGLIGAADVTDFKKIAAAVNNSKSLSPEEKNSMVGYMGANPTPSTNLQVHITGQQEGNALAEDKMFTGKEVIVHGADGSRKQMSYGDAKKAGVPLDQMTILNANEAQQNRDKYASVSTTMDHVKRYRNDFKTISSQLTPKDRSALGVLTSHQDKVADSFLGVAASGVIDTLMQKPLTGYSEKLMGSWMTKDQYDQMSPAGKKMLADYVATALANFANIKAVMGSVPRNPQIIQLEVARVPLPYIDWQSASPAFDNFRDDIKGRSGSLPQIQ